MLNVQIKRQLVCSLSQLCEEYRQLNTVNST